MAEEKTFLAQCEDCKTKAPVEIVHKQEVKVNGRSIFLTYYDCPKCGRRHFVQIDDTTSMQMLQETKRLFVKLAVKRRNGKQIPQKQSEKWKKFEQHLSGYRKKLMQEFTGKTIKWETGEDVTLRFSV